MHIKILQIISIIILSILSCKAIAETNLIITNANIVNPTDQKIIPHLGYIIIQDDKIKKVGYGKIADQKNISIYDAKKAYVIPGLIDTHNHIDTVLGVPDSNTNFDIPYRKQLPRSYLFFGYTTIIDVATSNQDAINIFNSNATHPDLYTCGGGITVANGYPMSEYPDDTRFKIFPNFIYEPNQNKNLPNNFNAAEHTPSRIIKKIVDAKAVCVKIFYESGFGPDKNLPLPSLESVKEIVRLAHQHHLPVLIHANSIKAQQFVLASGADIFAHGMWNWGDDEGRAGLPSAIKNVLDQAIKKQFGYQPTMQVIYGLDALFDPTFLDEPHLTKVIPPSLLAWYKTKAGQWLANIMVEEAPKSVVEKRFRQKENQINRVVNYLQKNHANLLFGTDTPSSPTYGNPPGYNEYLEMQNWYRAGVALPEILIAATIRNAKFFHLDKKYGSIAPGKIANLVIMKDNPLKNIQAYDSIIAVTVHGKIYDRQHFVAN